MAIITLRLANVNSKTEGRPVNCPHCGSVILRGWGKVLKRVRDTQLAQVEVRRYRCTDCRRTFRDYPEGVTKADQSTRLQQLGALLWAFGVSLRRASGVLGAFGVVLCHMSVWRDVQRLAEEIRREVARRRVRVVGLDGMYSEIRGKGKGMVIAVDMGTGKPVALARIDERDVDAMTAWLGPLLEQLGVETVVTDDLAAYGVIVGRLGVEHQVCDFHLSRWVGRALQGLGTDLGEEYSEAIEEVERIVREKPPDGRWRLQMLWERIRPLWRKRKGPAEAVHRFRMLILRLAENWERYTLFQRRGDVPRTNNRAEQAIGGGGYAARACAASRVGRDWRRLSGCVVAESPKATRGCTTSQMDRIQQTAPPCM